MFDLDLCLRVFAFSQLILIATQALFLSAKNVNFALASAYSLSVSAYLTISPLWYFDNRGWLIWTCSLFSSLAPLILFALGNRVFESLLEPWQEKALGGAYLVVSLAAHLEAFPPVINTTIGFRLMWVAGAVLIGIALLNIIKGWSTDLVESRRRLRLFCGSVLVICAFSWYLLAFLEVSPDWGMGSLGSVFEMTIVALGAFLFNLTDWRGKNSILMPIIAKDNSILLKGKVVELITLMEEEKIYEEPSLTLKELAKRIYISEAKLRQIIHKQVGAINFNDFVNSYRVKEAASRLLKNDTKILDLAYEVGFSSLAPFNKAFKKEYALTPTQYRKQAEKG